MKWSNWFSLIPWTFGIIFGLGIAWAMIKPLPARTEKLETKVQAIEISVAEIKTELKFLPKLTAVEVIKEWKKNGREK